MNKGHDYWTTHSEEVFIRNLGSFACKCNFTPEELLEKYIKATKLRVIWNGIDRKECIRIAKEQLRKCRHGN